MTQQPLRGIHVVDFGQYIAGPLAAMLLADQGAEVTHIDPPGGPRWRTPANQTWNRGKRLMELDLRSASGVESARELVAASDVVIENFRPGVMDRLGLGHSICAESNPRLVYCSLPGFAADDPRAQLAGWEGVIAAATDTYRGEPPVFTPIPISSHFAAIHAALAITMALIARERDGYGQRIEVPLFDATFAAIGAHGLFVDGGPGGIRPDDFWTGLFECGDGRWIQVSLATPRFRTVFTAALNLDDWLMDLDRLSADAQLRADLRQRQSALFASRSAQEWEDLGGRIGVPIAVCRTTSEWIGTPHARSAGIVLERDGALQPGTPIRMGDVPLHTGTPMRKDGITSDAPATRPSAQGETALAGVRVLDLTQVLAGPTAGRTLAEYGADVIKINNPHEEGAGIHFSRHRYHTDVNPGKRSLLLDLKSAPGQTILHDLVARSDVVLQNFRPEAAERLRVRYQDIRALQPNIVYLTVSAFGGPGPWTGWPGYEVQAQAASGLRYARTGRPPGQPFAVNDYGTGLLGAFAVGLALFQRLRTGSGQAVEVALAYTATILQSATLHTDLTSRDGALGWSASHRLHRARDGWLFVANSEVTEDEFHSVTVADTMGRLSHDGASAHALVPVETLMRDDWVSRHGLSLTRVNDMGESITCVGPPARLSRTPVQPGRPAPSPGADAADILRDIGREADLQELLREGVIAVETVSAPRAAAPGPA
ncbi:MAG: CoA transferase [Chloroflexi bacterium]|nr:CoA transferase [Chloroflexota bacterium]